MSSFDSSQLLSLMVKVAAFRTCLDTITEGELRGLEEKIGAEIQRESNPYKVANRRELLFSIRLMLFAKREVATNEMPKAEMEKLREAHQSPSDRVLHELVKTILKP